MCAEDGPEDTGFGLRLLESRVSTAYLQREAIQPGYAVVVWTSPHVVEPTELSPDDAAAYLADALDAGRLIEAHFAPVEINYQTLGNALPHLHAHVIPRYADDGAPGRPLPFPEGRPGTIPEAELTETVAALRVLPVRLPRRGWRAAPNAAAPPITLLSADLRQGTGRGARRARRRPRRAGCGRRARGAWSTGDSRDPDDARDGGGARRMREWRTCPRP
jgi:diadenosine tetraphosphate (Ap4A) HIT family hydrolase